MKTETIYGYHPVTEALRAARRRFHEVYVVDGRESRRLDTIIKLAESRDIPIKKVGQGELRKITDSSQHQGIGARTGPFPLTGLSSMIQDSGTGDRNRFILVLDGLNDPNNLGAIVRTAAAFGVDGIVLPKDRSVSPTPAASRASAGTLEWTRVTRVTNIVNTIRELKKHGFWIYGLAPRAGSSLLEMETAGAMAMIVGGEEKGIRRLVKQHCDYLVSIPHASGRVESLNASVAGAIAMYEVFRLRLK